MDELTSGARSLEERRATLEEQLRRLGIDSLRVQTGEDYLRPLSRFFDLRERQRSRRR